MECSDPGPQEDVVGKRPDAGEVKRLKRPTILGGAAPREWPVIPPHAVLFGVWSRGRLKSGYHLANKAQFRILQDSFSSANKFPRIMPLALNALDAVPLV
jgi:hypothetical protein